MILGSSPEKLHADLAIQPHAVMVASELADFFNRQKYMEGMVPYVTRLLDCEPVEKRTKSYDILRVEKPEVTVLGGSTKQWLQEQLPDSAVTGGFLARFLIVKEDEKRQRVANPDTFLTRKQKLELDHIRAKIFQDFYHALHSASGEVKFADFGVDDMYAVWYNSHKPVTGHLAPFAARAGEFVRRLSMILAVAENNPAITEADLDAAIKIYSYIETKLQEVVVPYTATGRLISLVLDAIPLMGATERDITSAMRNFCTAQDTKKYLDSLLISGDLRAKEGRFYRTA